MTWINGLEQLTSGNCGRRWCGSAAAIATTVGLGAGVKRGVDSIRDAYNKPAKEAAKAQKEAAAQAAAAQSAAAAATPNSGRAMDASAIEAAVQRKRGIQSTYLASRLAEGGDKLGA